jgi:hypothetical protein
MRRLQHRHLARQTHETILLLTWLHDHAPLIATRANNDIDDTQTTNANYGGPGSSDLTHPERHAQHRLALAVPDPVAHAMHELHDNLDAALLAAIRARNAAARLITDPTNHDAIRALALTKDKAGAGHCTTCSTYVPGIRSDRLRGGECEPCYRYRRDHHGNPRPAQLWGHENQATP